MWAAVELGGTKVNVALGKGPHIIQAQERIPTTTPDETLGQVKAFLKSHGEIQGIGIGCFGPVDLETGVIATTPKPGWAGTGVLNYFQNSFDCPLAFDTDVNGAVLGEKTWGAAKNLTDFVYVTIGTGIGGGAMVGGKLLHGFMHPEMGHMMPQLHPDDTDFKGVCRFHGKCLEGLASGPALHKRLGHPAQDAAKDHPVWDREADYLAQLCMNLFMSLSPRKIILGGGVMAQTALFPKIRDRFKERVNGYLPLPDLSNYIVAPKLGANAGLLGAMALIMVQQGEITS